MVWEIEVSSKAGERDVHGEDILRQVRDLGIESVKAVRSARLFHLDTDAGADDVARIARELLADPIVEEARISDGGRKARDPRPVVIVRRKPGVMDPVATSALQAIADMGLSARRCRTARKYYFEGRPARRDLESIARAVLANDCIEQIAYTDSSEGVFRDAPPYAFRLITVPLCEADDAALQRISKQGGLFLNLHEMHAIQAHFRALDRNPTDAELETLAQTWSEHCVHKTFRSDVVMRDNAGNEVERFENLIKSTVFKATKDLAKPWCLSVFEDNAGVIEFDEAHAVCLDRKSVV